MKVAIAVIRADRELERRVFKVFVDQVSQLIIKRVKKANVLAKCHRVYRRHTVRKVFKALEHAMKVKTEAKAKIAKMRAKVSRRIIFERMMVWKIYALRSKSQKAKRASAERFYRRNLSNLVF